MKMDLSSLTTQVVKVYYLRMHAPPVHVQQEKKGTAFQRLQNPVDTALYLKYYKGVGFHLNWLDRLVMPEVELFEKINAPNVHIYIMKVGDEEAGFLELVQEEKWVELNYFGLFPEQTGKGLGKYFLNWGIQKAWAFNPQWLQVNTCELDHANALATYKKAGFQQYETRTEHRRVLAA